MVNKFRRYYANLNLQNKLRLSYILLILVPVTLLCIVYYWVSSQSILDIAEKNILDVTVKNVQIIDRLLEDMLQGGVQINVDAEIYETMEQVESVEDSGLLLWDKKVQAVLRKYFPDTYIVSSNIMTRRYVFGDNSQLIIPTEKFYASDIYRQILDRPGVATWIPTYDVDSVYQLDYTEEEGQVFSMVQKLNPVRIDPESPNDVRYPREDTDAVLIVNFREAVVRDMFEGSNSVEGSFYCISSADGVIVSHSDAAKNASVEQLPWLNEIGNKKEGNLILRYGHEKVVVCYAVSEVTGWVAASVTPVHSLLHNVSKLQLLTAFVWILLFFMAMVLAAVFSRRITRPVERLVTAMKQVGKGEFGTRLPTFGTDEMQYLTEKYNEMSEKIQVLIEENYESEIRKKESEIMALNLQLNPHFLNNTLNIINMMALEEGNMEVSKMLISLSDMLQYTFRNAQEFVIFEEEYHWLQNYLHIMSVRFEGKFEVQYEVEKEVYRDLVPKLILQPLVENAILHGFRDMDSGGVIRVAATHEGDFLQIVVEDNGRGMTKQELERAMNGDYRRIGLSNAVRRLQLIYGDSASMKVDTAVRKGTRIFVRFPGKEK